MNSKLIFLGIIITGAIIGGAIIYTNSNQSTSSIASSGEQKKILKLNEQDHIKGNPEAKITILEFSDFECPFCAKFSQSVNQVMKDYPDDVNWVYRHFPLSFHKESRPSAEASECAAEQGKFWEFHDGLFTNQSGLGKEFYLTLAKDLELDLDSFEECFSSRKYKDRVENDYQEGINLGIKGTPGNFINGGSLGGAVPYEKLKLIVESILNN